MDQLKKTPSFQTNAPEPAEATALLAPLIWFKVNAVNLTGADPAIVQANMCRMDGTDVGNRNYTVASHAGRNSGDLIYCSRPQGGTKYSYNGEPISWAELLPRDIMRFGIVVTNWTPGSTSLQMTPASSGGTATGEANVTVAIEMPIGSIPSYCAYQAGDVIPYVDFNRDGTVCFLLCNKLPAPTAFGQGWYNNAATGSPANMVIGFLRGI